jgi:hypothetical protein
MEANHVEVRHLTREDMIELREASEQVYQAGPLLSWTTPVVDTLLTKFSDGWLCVCRRQSGRLCFFAYYRLQQI